MQVFGLAPMLEQRLSHGHRMLRGRNIVIWQIDVGARTIRVHLCLPFKAYTHTRISFPHRQSGFRHQILLAIVQNITWAKCQIHTAAPGPRLSASVDGRAVWNFHLTLWPRVEHLLIEALFAEAESVDIDASLFQQLYGFGRIDLVEHGARIPGIQYWFYLQHYFVDI